MNFGGSNWHHHTWNYPLSGPASYPLPIFIFMVMCTWGAIELNSQFHVASKHEIGLLAFVVSFIIGIFIRNILRAVFVILVVMMAIGLLVAAGYYFYTHKSFEIKKLGKVEMISGNKENVGLYRNCEMCKSIYVNGADMQPGVKLTYDNHICRGIKKV